MNLIERHVSVWKSFRSLPGWVQIWVGLILVPANLACIFFLDTPIGIAAAVAGVFVLLTNTPIMLYYGGMNRLLSAPHLVAWGPLAVFIAWRLWSSDSGILVGSPEYIYGAVLFVINGISLAFDLLDTWRWMRGERETPGLGQPAR